MRSVPARAVEEKVRDLCIDINYHMPRDMLQAFERARETEVSPPGREVLTQLLANARTAASEGLPYCQDTGTAVVYIRQGEEVRVEGRLEEAVHRGVSAGTREGFLRGSIVRDPLRRQNTGDNTPPVLHVEREPGDKFHIAVMAKGSGAENMSQLRMLTPADGPDGIRRFVLQVVREAGPNACPPVTIGLGIGSTFDTVAWLAKKALFRPLGRRNPDPYYADLEVALLRDINRLGIGPMGFGGKNTALDLRIETAPCHIAALPVAVNLECHAHRVREAEL
ncbi:MAG: fumarate hydratase [Euryarchaeota archaeon]|nr:fumarate hydratase [Euryarchaeota archaeon]